MRISADIELEALFFLFSILTGIGLVIVYDLFRILRRLVKHGTIWMGVEDLLYWLFCAVSVFLLLYKENEGRMRAFSFMGMIIGMMVYELLLSRFVIKMGVFLLRPIFETGKKILFFLRKVLKKVVKAIKMGLCKR